MQVTFLVSIALALTVTIAEAQGHYNYGEGPVDYQGYHHNNQYIDCEKWCFENGRNGYTAANHNRCECKNHYLIPQPSLKKPTIIWEEITGNFEPIDVEYYNTKLHSYYPKNKVYMYIDPKHTKSSYIDNGLYTIYKNNIPLVEFSSDLKYMKYLQPINTDQYQHSSYSDYENINKPTFDYKNEPSSYINYNNEKTSAPEHATESYSPYEAKKDDDSLEKARHNEGNYTVQETSFTNFDDNSAKFNKSLIDENTVADSKHNKTKEHNETLIGKMKNVNNKEIKTSDSSKTATHNRRNANEEHENGSPIHYLSKENNYGFGKNERPMKRNVRSYSEKEDYERRPIAIDINHNEVCMVLNDLSISCHDVFEKMCQIKKDLPICI